MLLKDLSHMLYYRPFSEHICGQSVVQVSGWCHPLVRGHIQAMAVWLHSCSNVAKSDLRSPELFLGQFHRFNDENFRDDCLGSAKGGVKNLLCFPGVCKRSCHQDPWKGFFANNFFTTAFFTFLPQRILRSSALVYLCLVKIRKIWMEQFWKLQTVFQRV